MTDNPKPNSLPEWLGIANAPNWAVSRPLGVLFGVCLMLLFTLALVSAFVVTSSAIVSAFNPQTGGANLGVGALIVALLGGPFLIWRTMVAQRTVDLQKEGLMTDRISKAVEQLGAEKTVKEYGIDEAGKPIPVERTVPNIEVRIGGLLSLERISQDSVKYDKGRDHVRVMEILCAYVRENAKASGAEVSLREKYEKARKQWDGDPDHFDEWFCVEHKLFQPDIQDFTSIQSLRAWTYSLPHPRADIAMALQIICRRDEKQIKIENENSPPYCLDLRRTNLQKAVLQGGKFQNAGLFEARMEGSYCNDTDFSGTKLASAHLVGAGASRACFDHASLSFTNFNLAILTEASFHNCSGAFASFNSSRLNRTRFTRDAPLDAGAVNRMNFENCQFLGAYFDNIRPVAAYNFLNQYADQTPDFSGFKGAAFRNSDLPRQWLTRGIDPAFIFADASVALPSNFARPKHWPSKPLEAATFETEWRKWQAKPETYTPP